MEDCVFCKVVAGELPSWRIYENDNVLAFLDIHPVSHGHTLVIPKQHHVRALETPDDLLSEIVVTAKRVAPAIAQVTGATSFNITFNNGADAGEIIPHTHLHIIPRHKNDNLESWPSQEYKEGEKDKLAEKMRGAL